jgi:spore maturation protein CgeB
MRLVKVTTFYDAYLRQFYRRHPLLTVSPYAEQRRQLLRDGFGWADFFQGPLAAHGYDADDLVINAKPLQRAWAREAGLSFPRGDWTLEVALEQIRRADPEVLFLDDTSTFPAEWIARARAACPHVRLVLGWSGTPSSRADALAAYDAVLSCIPELVTELAAAGVRAFHLHHAFEPRLLERINAKSAPVHDLTFVGQMVPDSLFHQERQRMLLRLAEEFDIRVYSPMGQESLSARVKSALKPVLRPIAAALDRAPIPARIRNAVPLPPADSPAFQPRTMFPSALARRVRRPVFGLEMFQTLRDSRVTFNCHIGASRRSATNMRLFEATGVGSCLLTDAKDDLGRLFAVDEEVVAYRSLDECLDKVRWLLANPGRAEDIGRRGQRRTLRDHTFVQRAEALHEIIRGLLA